MTTAFDKSDNHVDGAVQAGQPEGHAFTHIGLYLAWLIRHDLCNPNFIRPDWAVAVKAGEMTGSDLADAIDGKLVSDLMTPEGAAFTAAHYDDYLDDYATVFASEADYSVADDLGAYARIAPAIDRRYEAWVAGGRPKVGQHEPDPVPPDASDPRIAAGETTEAKRRRTLDDFRTMAQARGWVIESSSGPEQLSHAARDLEELVPRDISQPPMSTDSVRANVGGNALLKRALKRLSVKPEECVVVNGIGGQGAGMVTVTLYAIRQLSADELEREFMTVLHPSGGQWEERTIAGKRVYWAGGREFQVAFWALDGMVVHASAVDSRGLERLVARLP
ncbi:MAG: hypothetical protein M3406_14665 [Chloroflexota bacterium]|nr:hypothetical protein [Chloroflexota bacterium]